MNIVNYINSCLELKNISWRKFAALTEQSQSNLMNKKKRGKFMTDELELFARVLNAHIEIRFIDNETNKPFALCD